MLELEAPVGTVLLLPGIVGTLQQRCARWTSGNHSSASRQPFLSKCGINRCETLMNRNIWATVTVSLMEVDGDAHLSLEVRSSEQTSRLHQILHGYTRRAV